jgi:hypothetical protein
MLYPKSIYSCWRVSDGAPSSGLFNFAQQALPLLLESVESSPHPPSLILSGATASLRGRAHWADIAAGKSAQRILLQSIAREFGPKGVHAAHAIIDGGIDIPKLKHINFNNGAPDGKISPDAVSKPHHMLVIWSIDFLEDCRKLLVPAYTAQISLYPRAGLEALRRAILELIHSELLYNVEFLKNILFIQGARLKLIAC